MHRRRIDTVNSDVIGVARSLAAHAHKGQRDKMSRDYFDAHLVPIASAASVFGDDVEAAAWLHDGPEDTVLTFDDLRDRGMPLTVVSAVDSVTRREGETYACLIHRSCADPVGRYVKLVDNAWNITCNPALAKMDPAKAQSLLDGRYKPARQKLLHACGLELESPLVVQMQAILDQHDQRLRSHG